jgi:hypothetical protein
MLRPNSPPDQPSPPRPRQLGLEPCPISVQLDVTVAMAHSPSNCNGASGDQGCVSTPTRSIRAAAA